MSRRERKRVYMAIGCLLLAMGLVSLVLAIWLWNEKWALQGGLAVFTSFYFMLAGLES